MFASTELRKAKLDYRLAFQKFSQERTKSSSRCLISWIREKLGYKTRSFSIPGTSLEQRASHRSRIMYRYLIYLCDRPRCQSIHRGTGLKQARGEERLVIDFPDVEREFCLAGKSFPLLAIYPWNLIGEQFAVVAGDHSGHVQLSSTRILSSLAIFVDDERETIGSPGNRRRIAPETTEYVRLFCSSKTATRWNHSAYSLYTRRDFLSFLCVCLGFVDALFEWSVNWH